MPKRKRRKISDDDKLVSFKFSMSNKKDAEIIGFLNAKSKYDRGEWIVKAVRLKYNLHKMDVTTSDEELEQLLINCIKKRNTEVKL